MQTNPKSRVITLAALVTGNMVGAGILGLPVDTGLSGFVPAIIAMAAIWTLMLSTALILSGHLSEQQDEDFDLPALFSKYLGKSGKWLAVAANMIILYGLLVAYLVGGSTVLCQIFPDSLPPWGMTLCFFAFTTGITVVGPMIVEKANAFLMIFMAAAFAGLVVFTAPHAKISRLEYHDWLLFSSVIPIMITSFHFHNILPTVCRGLKWDMGGIKKAVVLGAGAGLIMNIAWISVVLGALPVAGENQANLLFAYEHGQPATLPLSQFINLDVFTYLGVAFAMVAITTSFLANGTALMGFMRDLGKQVRGRSNKVFEICLTFLPPLLVALFYPDLFLKALDLVGGVGIALLFGILPGGLAWKLGKTKAVRVLGVILMVAFGLVLSIEIAQELGFLNIDPEREVWKSMLPRH